MTSFKPIARALGSLWPHLMRGTASLAPLISTGLRPRKMAKVEDLLSGVSTHTWDVAWRAAWNGCNTVQSWTRLIMPTIAIPPRIGGQEGTFQWIKPPPCDGLPCSATAYTDGSGFDVNMPQVAVYGWAFIVVGAQGEVVAEAAGVVPDRVTSVSEAEAWALVQAARVCMLGTRYITDCAAVKQQIAAGRTKATAADRPLARVMGLAHRLLDDSQSRDTVLWMPSHCTSSSARGRELSDGAPISEGDRAANDRADALAKAQARGARAPPALRANIAAGRVLAFRVAAHL